MNKIVSRAIASTAIAFALVWSSTASAQAGKAATAAAGSAANPAKSQAKAAASTANAAPAAASNAAAGAAASAVVDINKATADELKKVPGIGDAYATKIIAGRPYANKAQLVTKHVMPQGVYDKVKTHLIAKQ